MKAEVQNLGGELIVSGVSLTTQSRTWLLPQRALRLEWLHLVRLESIFFLSPCNTGGQTLQLKITMKLGRAVLRVMQIKADAIIAD